MSRAYRLLAATLLAAALTLQPAQAQTASEPAIDTYYTSRSEAPIWLRDESTRAAARDFVAILRNATLDGVADAPQLAQSVEAAIARAQPSDDKTVSSAWVRFVSALKGPVNGIEYGDPALKPQPPSAEIILAHAAQAASLSDHVRAVAAVNPLYFAIREAAVKQGATNDPHVRATLERLRLVPAEGRAVIVDAASAQLSMLEDGRVVDTMKVVVGKKQSPSPLIASTIHFVTFNPYWHIPDDVARDKVAPLVLKRGVSYLKAARYETAETYKSDAALVDPTTIDWKAVAAGSAPVYMRQLPGSANMMGAMKVPFANRFDIYLHDTPKDARHLGLFAKAQRNFSMGCIRLEHADRLVGWLLGREPTASGDAPEQNVAIGKGVPIFVTYLTANVDAGQLVFVPDVYGLDPAPAAMAASNPPQSSASAAPQ